MRIGFGLDVARLNIDEIVTGLWSFTNPAGIRVDDINEFTPTLGVLIDGLLLKDKAAFMRSLVLATDTVLGSAVAGDGFDRFEVLADGRQVWGDGAGAVDTNLYRDAANVLKTDDSLEVGGSLGVVGALTASGVLDLSKQETTLAAQANNFDLGGKTIQAFSLTGAQNISGLVAAGAPRLVVISNVDAVDSLTLLQASGGSDPDNRFLLPGGVDRVIPFAAGVVLWYDENVTVWRVLS